MRDYNINRNLHRLIFRTFGSPRDPYQLPSILPNSLTPKLTSIGGVDKTRQVGSTGNVNSMQSRNSFTNVNRNRRSKGQHLVNVVKECPLKLQKLMNYLSKTHTYLGNYKTDNAPSEFISTNCVVLQVTSVFPIGQWGLLRKFKQYIGCFQWIATYCMETYIVKQKQIQTRVLPIYVGGLVIH